MSCKDVGTRHTIHPTTQDIERHGTTVTTLTPLHTHSIGYRTSAPSMTSTPSPSTPQLRHESTTTSESPTTDMLHSGPTYNTPSTTHNSMNFINTPSSINEYVEQPTQVNRTTSYVGPLVAENPATVVTEYNQHHHVTFDHQITTSEADVLIDTSTINIEQSTRHYKRVSTTSSIIEAEDVVSLDTTSRDKLLGHPTKHSMFNLSNAHQSSTDIVANNLASHTALPALQECFRCSSVLSGVSCLSLYIRSFSRSNDPWVLCACSSSGFTMASDAGSCIGLVFRCCWFNVLALYLLYVLSPLYIFFLT